MKNIHFLAGLPRSGSTVLAGVLNQHPEIHASATSGLLDMLVGTLRAWADSFSAQAAAIPKEESELEVQRILRTICEEKYSHIDKPIIIDKARSWASSINIPTMAKILGHKPKIIATVRNIPDCVASMVRIAKPDDVNNFLRTSELVSHIKESYKVLESGYQFAPECILFVDYDDLMDDPKKQLDRVHEFLGLSDWTYDFNNIDGFGLQERDEEIWEVKGLHDVKPKLGYQHKEDSKDVLKHRYWEFVQPRFWVGEKANPWPRSVSVQIGERR
jgi:sulfotransferase